jgi:cyclophilin family peptidyl-prolyl cis-trans isomerase
MAELARAKRRSRNIRRSIIGVVVAAAVVGIVYLLVGNNATPSARSKGKTTTTTTKSTTSTTTTQPTTTTQAAVAPTCPPATAAGAPVRETNFTEAPKTCIVPTDTYKATFDTDVGSFVATLSAKANLAAVNNFVFLARWHFFDTTTFFRVEPGFVIQGGSADNTNSGSPAVSEAGYSWTGNVPPASCVAKKDCYPSYSIAMANAGTSSSDGSEFFIVLPGGGTQLGDLYTFVGQVTSGQAVVAKIGADGSSANNGIPPKVTHHIIKVTISQIPG